MNMADNNLSNLAKLSMDDMQVVQGIGDCKAWQYSQLWN